MSSDKKWNNLKYCNLGKSAIYIVTTKSPEWVFANRTSDDSLSWSFERYMNEIIYFTYLFHIIGTNSIRVLQAKVFKLFTFKEQYIKCSSNSLLVKHQDMVWI
jgi:hypothetical protein